MGYKLDEYMLKARVFPAFLALLPLGLFLGQFVNMRSAIAGACSGLGGSTLLSFMLADWARDVGKRKESELLRCWGCPPTTNYLRHRSTCANPVLRQRRKEKISELFPDIPGPTALMESERPEEADHYYEAMTKALIGKTRNKERFNILFQENVSYGFRRNAWALKPIAAIFCAVGMIGSIGLALENYALPYNMVSAALSCAALFGWLLIVDKAWVRRAADIYSDRLFSCLDELTPET
jgi:hypothetical protein